MSVHFKDMAVQPADDGFRLSEVPLGTGALDLPRIPCLTGDTSRLSRNEKQRASTQ